ncbi:MAG: transrane transcriptional regulator [Hydrocarboniphaga sp.]|uniref:anti-sigma factor family protein n=1 Tax=Hydrocarboniphaga sp. TaxID=2033016 RepID=UPI00263310A8|nr:anti-sigma factor [Hydrocarboniphaga sp.]MDB5970799.1 transrane transcriptional regulator [Hydrocarboniphaga sp.]
MNPNCDEVRELLSAYADAELDLARTLSLESHLAVCAECTARLQRLRDFSRVLRERAPYHRMPAALKSRLPGLLDDDDGRAAAGPRQHGRGQILQWALPIAAALTLSVGLNLLIGSRRADGALVDEVVAGHVRSMMVAHLDDVASTDRHTVKPWFAGKLDYAPPVFDLAAHGFPLAGGRLDYLDHRAVAALDYRRGRHVINVFVWPAAGAESEAEPLTNSGYNIERWTVGGMRWWAISDLNAGELTSFAEQLRAAAIGAE